MRTWEEHAACYGWPPELFQISKAGRALRGVVSVCAECPVVAECLADGWWDEWSVRGLTTPAQRAALAAYLAARVEPAAVAVA